MKASCAEYLRFNGGECNHSVEKSRKIRAFKVYFIWMLPRKQKVIQHLIMKTMI